MNAYQYAVNLRNAAEKNLPIVPCYEKFADEARALLHNLFIDDKHSAELQDSSLLVLVNKQDERDSMDIEEVGRGLRLRELGSRRCKLLGCSVSGTIRSISV